MNYRHVVVVTGLGQFPVDMLRYDCCFPATESDSELIEGSAGTVMLGKRPVLIKKTSRFKSVDRAFSLERWRSFGWEVELPDAFGENRLKVVKQRL